MSDGKAMAISAAIYEYFVGARNAENDARPFSFNEDQKTMSVCVDGEIYCAELAAFIAARISRDVG